MTPELARHRGRVVALLVAVCSFSLTAAWTDAAYTSDAGTVATMAASEWTPPTVDAAVLRKSSGGTAGAVAPGGEYHVYAAASDTGGVSPSGVTSVRADVRALTAAAQDVVLSPGSWVVDGRPYGFRSGPLTVDSAPAEGGVAFTVTATDAAANVGTGPGAAIVDSTAPSPSDVDAVNGGGQSGRIDAGDVVTLVRSEDVEPGTVLDGWSGASIDVSVVGIDGSGPGDPDTLTVHSAGGAGPLPLGVVSLGRHDYLSTSVTMTGSTMLMSGESIVITLAAPSSASPAPPGGPGTAGSLQWSPDAAVTDHAGNPTSGSAAESGFDDRDF